MRLNRVLLLAASLSILIFAMVFTISCSGDDGKDGKNGKNAECTASASATGDAITITCDDGSTGTLRGNGPAGPQGPQGIQGPKGDPGIAGTLPDGICTLGKQDPTTGNWGITCGGHDIEGGNVSGEIVGCVNTASPSNSYQITLKCGSAEIYTCGGQYYNPTEYACKYGKVTDDAKFNSAYIKATNCGGTKYDSRTHFCGDGNKVTPLCGGAEYEEINKKETCVNNQVVKACGSLGSYIKATQFCMDEGTATAAITARCGVSSGGVYAIGDSASGDKTGPGGDYIKGEYSARLDQLCENNLIVKKCGTQSFQEATDFCAVGDIVTKHCDDRVQYNPSQRFCSYVGNRNYDASLSGKDCDAKTMPCKQYVSTPLPFCGSGTSAAKYNEGAWKWEYCVAKDLGTGTPGNAKVIGYSVLRCAQNMIPDGNPTGGSAIFETCRCIPGAQSGKVFTPTSGAANKFAPYGDGDPNYAYTYASGNPPEAVNATLAGSALNGCTCPTSFTDPDPSQSSNPDTKSKGYLAHAWNNNSGVLSSFRSTVVPATYYTFAGTGASLNSTTINQPSASVGGINIGTDLGSSMGILGGTADIANGYPNVKNLGAASVDAYPGGDGGFWFFGGVCYTKPGCKEQASLCKDLGECLATTNILSNGTHIWDPSASKCVARADKCIDGFGATAGTSFNGTPAWTCFATEQPCSESNPGACKTMQTCTAIKDVPDPNNAGKTLGHGSGYWDNYVSKNNCVKIVTDDVLPAASNCNSGKIIAGSKLCDAVNVEISGTPSCAAGYTFITDDCYVHQTCAAPNVWLTPTLAVTNPPSSQCVTKEFAEDAGAVPGTSSGTEATYGCDAGFTWFGTNTGAVGANKCVTIPTTTGIRTADVFTSSTNSTLIKWIGAGAVTGLTVDDTYCNDAALTTSTDRKCVSTCTATAQNACL